jgi:diacylglycerol kinase (ATP)
MSYVKGRLRSVGFALQGLHALWATQPNVRIHAVATSCVVAAGWYCQIGRTDWLALVLAIALVWVAEALNTGIEWAVDLASPDHHPLAGKAKDVAAAGVLLASMAAVVIGLLVFVPRLF